MSMHKAEMHPRKDFIASAICTVVVWSLFTSCAGLGFFITELAMTDHIERSHVAPFFALSWVALICSVPYGYIKMKWAVCERCFSYVCFKKDTGVCRDCEAQYLVVGDNVFRDRNL